MPTTTMTRIRPMYNRGDVILVLFPHSDLMSAKTRPALVVQADDLRTDLQQIVVAMITSRMFRANHPSRVAVHLSDAIGENSGLLADSVVMTDNLVTVAESVIDRKIGVIPMQQIDKALHHTLGL